MPRPVLAEYRRKRDFGKTPEPAGKPSRRTSTADSFVVHKHAARRLHYDFRLALDGALKSWAVPKGPSLDPRQMRLAVEVEDHPLDYGDFEGVIPKGQYGAGSVIIWDHGTWEPLEDPHEGLARGRLKFRLHGEKLQGSWLLVRTSGSATKPQWLLRKLADEWATREHDIVEERPESVVTNRSVERVAQQPERVWHGKGATRAAPATSRIRGAVTKPLPDAIEPELATLVDAPPPGDEWLHEVKFDGYRILCRIDRGRATLRSRSGKDWTASFPIIASEAPFLRARTALLDGEIVWLDDDGKSHFQSLQNGLTGASRTAPIYYYAFDLLHLDGHDLRAASLSARKDLLRQLLVPPPAEATHLRFSDHLRGEGRRFLDMACEKGLEGIVSKRETAPYRSGRGRDWLKVKCKSRQEFVIVGFTDPAGARSGFGALLLGYYEEKSLVFAGKVGTGFDEATLLALHRELGKIERPRSPLDRGIELARRQGVHWVEPRLVAEVGFTEWTRDGILRHPTFHGLRADKQPREVRRDEPLRLGRPGADPPPQPARVESSASAPPPSRKRRTPGAARPAPRIAGVTLSNPDRVFWPDVGITKLDLARYYESVAEWMLPHVEKRLLTLVRCPKGHEEHCFYQKHIDEPAEALHPVEIREKKGELQSYLMLDSVAGLVTLAQLGVLEIHPWGSRVDDVNHPDRLIFDFDPDPSVPWKEVAAAARDFHAFLTELGLESFPRLTGGKGVHVVVPLVPEIDWDSARDLTRAMAQLFASRAPERFTLNPRKAQRRGKIFIDTLRNAFGSTAVASYSTRARASAPVAVPVHWDEVRASTDPASFTLRSVQQKLRRRPADPWSEMLTLKQRLRSDLRGQLSEPPRRRSRRA